MEALFKAIKSNDLKKVKELIVNIPSREFAEFDENTTDSSGEYTALMYACEYSNSIEIIKALLEKGALVGYEISYCDNTVLKSLARGVNSDLEMLELLAKAHGEDMAYLVKGDGNSSADDVQSVDSTTMLTPIDLAEQHGKSVYVKKFKSYL